MHRKHLAILSVCVLFLTGTSGTPAWAQTEAPVGPAPGAVLSHIPTGAMGFLVVNDVEKLTGKIDDYVETIGMADMAQGVMPTGLLDLVRASARLGEGFDPRGGFAVVMLDPADFGIDVPALLERGAAGEPAPEVKWPFVLLLGGRSIEDVFTNYQITPPDSENGYARVALRMGEMFAGEMGDYLALSPRSDALDALSGAAGTVASALPAGHPALLSGSDLGLHVNMDVAGPILDAVMQQAEVKITEMQAQAGEMGPQGPGMMMSPTKAWGQMLPMYRMMVRQVADATVGMRLLPEGLVADKLLAPRPGTPLETMVAYSEGVSGSPLDSVPGMDYVLALGMAMPTGQAREAYRQFNDRIMEQMWNLYPGLTQEQQERIQETAGRSIDLIDEIQVSFGGAPEGSGVMGLTYLLKGEDARAIRAWLKEYIPLVNELYSTSTMPPEIRGMKLAYEENVETAVANIEDAQVDAVSIQLPEQPSPQDHQQLQDLFGQEALRVFVVPADDKSLVIAFGGEGYLADAISRARQGSGQIPVSPGFPDAMAHMPANAGMVMLLKPSNIFPLIDRAQQASGQQAPPMPIRFMHETPLTMGVGIRDGSAHIAGLIPTDFVRDVSGAVRMFMMMQSGPPPQPGPGAPGGQPAPVR